MSSAHIRDVAEVLDLASRGRVYLDRDTCFYLAKALDDEGVLKESAAGDNVHLGTITVALSLDDNDVNLSINLPRDELSVLQMLGMLDLAREAVLHPVDDTGGEARP